MQRLSGLLDLFLESGCLLCQRSCAGELCQGCQRQIQRCQRSDVQWQEPLPLFVGGVYGGALKRAIATLKYENQPRLARPLGHWLAQTWLESPQAKLKQQLTVVPIPMYAAKKKQRGYDQAELLAKHFCDFAGLPLQPQGLERIRATEAQFTLSATEREQNLSDAFQLGRGFQRRCPAAVLLLDDVYTTGATARSAAQTLQRCGIEVVGLAAIAKPIMEDDSQSNSFKRPMRGA
ncbi:MAG: ComF family protein [Leptolyngbyaceae cyanobacterium RM1_406_9]|nr:ComF family protein [Leptolyngbyaceae cyanobacterium RM1_406_9]